MPPDTAEVTEVGSRIPSWPRVPPKFTRPSHLGFDVEPNPVFCSFRTPNPVGSIPIARSTFRCLACPCVVLGRDLAYRPVPTVSMRLQPVFSDQLCTVV